MDSNLLQYVRGCVASYKAAGGSYSGLARATGVPFATLRFIAIGKTKNPGVGTVEKLANYFRAAPPATSTPK